ADARAVLRHPAPAGGRRVFAVEQLLRATLLGGQLAAGLALLFLGKVARLGLHLMEVEIGVTPAAGESRIGEGLPLRSEVDHLSIDLLRRARVSEALLAQRQVRERCGILGRELRRRFELGARRREVLRAKELGPFG